MMVGTKNALSEPAKLLASLAGSAATVVLVLTLFAITTGISSRAVAYIKESEADIWVMSPGSSNVHMSTSVLPLTKLDEIRRTKGVARAYNILYAPQFVVVEGRETERKFFSYVVGFAGKEGGPWRMASGRFPQKGLEIAIDEVMAGKADIGLGDRVTLWGRPFEVVGLARETFSMANTLVFIPRRTMASLTESKGTTNYLLVEKKPAYSSALVVRNIHREVERVNAFTKSRLVANDERMIFSMSLDLLYVMSAISYLVALMVVGLISYTSTLSRLREFGVLKAVGAARKSLYRIVLEQSALPALVGSVAGVLVALALGAAIEPRLPEIPFQFETTQVLFVTLSLLLISLAAAAIPIRKVARLDPMIVFRR